MKGKKKIVATEVEVAWKSFNHGDIFVLEHKDRVKTIKIYLIEIIIKIHLRYINGTVEIQIPLSESKPVA